MREANYLLIGGEMIVRCLNVLQLNLINFLKERDYRSDLDFRYRSTHLCV